MIGPPRKSSPYPFAALDIAKEKALAEGIDVIDFGMGDPRDATPEFIRVALANSISEISSYPRANGLPELRVAIRDWARRRFDVELDSDNAILPTLGAKEIIHSLAAYAVDERRDTIVVPSPAYPVYERGATFHGASVHELPLLAENQFLPDLAAVPEEVWQRTALLWLNYPNNPTGAVAPLALYEEAATLARQHDFICASDEAYSEIWFDAKPVSALQLTDHSNVLVLNTLSKRSCMTGYRSGFIAGDRLLIDRLRTYRASVGVTPQDFVQRASIAAWNDDAHVEELRQRWLTRHNIINDALTESGVGANSPATFFLWTPVPKGHSSGSFATFLINNGLVVTPGSAFGPYGEGFVRFAVVPTIEDCQRAAQRLREILTKEI